MDIGNKKTDPALMAIAFGCSIHYTLLFQIYLEYVIRFLPFAMA
ncbi:hypothetical protein ADIS_2125 [Lunatimonas lonarensis]|uniref:Uncharacterized protein n=1 Tax=Lunatimonas lonarensis TaxID=1232681 RepID=R7ZTI6_9BACT|nr:hypothetical protein ADIS_2125 [Lunatimonas lonarensis]